MKLYTIFIAGLAAQAPPESKTCPDCKSMDAAYKDEVKNNPGLIDEYVAMVQGRVVKLRIRAYPQ